MCDPSDPAAWREVSLAVAAALREFAFDVDDAGVVRWK
jgi:hypothetical protein